MGKVRVDHHVRVLDQGHYLGREAPLVDDEGVTLRIFPLVPAFLFDERVEVEIAEAQRLGERLREPGLSRAGRAGDADDTVPRCWCH